MAFVQVTITATLFLAAVLPTTRAACSGYDIKDLAIQPIDNSIVQPSGNTAKLEEIEGKCHVVIEEKIVVTSDFSTAQMKFVVKKDGVTMMEKEVDYCKEMESPESDMGKIMQEYCPKCPVSKGELKMPPMDVSKYSGMLSMMQGSYNVEVAAEHGSGNSGATITFQIAEI